MEITHRLGPKVTLKGEGNACFVGVTWHVYLQMDVTSFHLV